MAETIAGGRVLIADDHPLIREGLGLAARAAMPGVTVDTAGTIGEALDALSRHGKYRLILLDFVLPDARGFSGFLQLRFCAFVLLRMRWLVHPCFHTHARFRGSSAHDPAACHR